MKALVLASVCLVLASCSREDKLLTENPITPPVAPGEPAAMLPDISKLPAGAYKTDASHTSLVFHVSHLGFSDYTATFDNVTATLELDPAKPEDAKLTATINPMSLDLPSPPEGFLAELMGAQWFDAAKYPEIRFTSTSVMPTSPTTADVAGALTLHGISQPVTMQVIFNGGYEGHVMDPNARIGFSATGSLKRSQFDMATGIPQPGSNMGVGDEVRFSIETEMSGPAMSQGAAAPGQAPAAP